MPRSAVTRPGEPSELDTETRVIDDASRDDDDVHLPAGAQIGRYVVLFELARGGMGVIYVAYDPQLDRRIALKLLRSRSSAKNDDRSSRARLLREAQAMARVTHPHVVTVHDVGLHGEDVFVAMELVEGGTLKTWWRERDRDWQEVLGVLCQAGEGLQAAHEQGVMHRDFKPDNVLIGDDGRVAVADFGLARALATSLDRGTLSRSIDISVSMQSGDNRLELSDNLTQTGAVVGTPAYMAPEQHSRKPGDVRTDIFSFCVTAYEALYRTRPFEGRTVAKVAASVMAGAVKPPPPDTWVPSRIHQALVRGLAVDPADRPASMAELLEELRPRPTVPRWRWALLGAGVLVATAGVGYAAGLFTEQPCESDPTRFSGAWDAERRAALARAITATERPFAEDLTQRTQDALDRYATRWTDEARAVCEATHVHQTQSDALLDLRMACLDRHVDAMRVAVQTLERGDAELLDHAIDVVRGLPEPDVCSNADVLQRTALPADPRVRAAADELRDQMVAIRVLLDGGTPLQAQPQVERALEQAHTLGQPALLSEALRLRARVHERTEHFEPAREALQQAMAAAIEAGDDHQAAEVAIAATFTVGRHHSDLAGAQGWDRQAQAWLARLGRPDRLEADRLDARAMAYLEADRYDEAMEDLQQALVLLERTQASDDPERAGVLTHVGDTFIAQGRYADAVERYREALTIYEAVYGKEHPRLIAPLNNLGVTMMDLGRLDEARALFERTRVMIDASIGARSRTMALALRNLSDVDREQGRIDDAIDKIRRAVAIHQEAQPEHDKASVSTLGALATTLARARRFEEATEVFAAVHTAQVELTGPQSLGAVLAQNNLGTVLVEQGRYDEGVPHLHEALAAKERLLGVEHPTLTSTLTAIGGSLFAQEQLREALPYFERAEQIQRKASGEVHPGVANTMLSRGSILHQLGERVEARPLIERALEIREQTKVGPGLRAKARMALARLLREEGEGARAQALGELAAKELEEAGAPAAQELAEVRQWLAER